MSDMKCPFCQQELREIYCYGVVMGYLCPNPDCKPVFKGNIELWQELIRTRKALEIAVDTLDVISQITNQIDVCDTANDALNTITSLKQKDTK